MVFVDPNDPESVEQASEILQSQIHVLVDSLKRAIYASWLRLKDVNAVETMYQRIFTRAIDDFRGDPDEYMQSLEMETKNATDQSMADPAVGKRAREQQIRIILYLIWMGLPPERRNLDELNIDIQKILDSAMYDVRGDAFGLNN
ncbi:hypothetical protein [Planctomycetes bacterium TBK1r]|uniref:Uncharacterized protein n=1 Tax=Stieleria magnilauensis TaxID=2527963 RepID=A0ABX5Y3D1_9BACT|nr:hypothetical protein TBK1r_78380 [Planctomycetes bacterium TBK1r]